MSVTAQHDAMHILSVRSVKLATRESGKAMASRQRTVAILVPLLLCPTLARATARLQGKAFTASPVKTVTVRVWALGQSVIANPALALNPLAEAKVEPGVAFDFEVRGASLPLRVEVSAPEHVAAALDVVFAEQLPLLPVWLPRGRGVVVRATDSGRPAIGAVLRGTFSFGGVASSPPHWWPCIPATVLGSPGGVEVWLPDEDVAATLEVLAPSGRWGRVSSRRPVANGIVVAAASRPLLVRVRDRQGEPVPGALVAGDGPAGTAVLSETDGTATVQIAAADDWAVVARSTGLEARRRRHGAPPPQGVSLELAPPPELEVRWQDQTGRVALEPAWSSAALSGNAPILAGGGRVFVPFRVPGGMITAWAPGIAITGAEVSAADTPVALALTPAAAVAGRVIDGSGTPLVGVPVWISETPLRMRTLSSRGYASMDRPVMSLLPWAVSGNGGVFTVGGLAGGRHVLTARRAGWPPVEAVLDLRPGSTTEAVLALTPGTAASLVVMDTDHRPIAGVTVAAHYGGSPPADGGPTGEPIAVGESTVEGRVSLRPLRKGPLTLHLGKPGYVSRSFSARVEEDGQDLGEVVLESGCAVNGQVVDDAGGAVAGAAIRIGSNERLLGVPQAFSDAQGYFTVADQPMQGEMLIEARAEGFVSPGAQRVTLPPLAPVSIALQRARRLAGRVLDQASAEPVVAASVVAVRADDRPGQQGTRSQRTRQSARALSDDEGCFRLGGLLPGDLELQVTAAGYRSAARPATIVSDGDTSDLTIVLDRGLAISGRVVDAAGAPVGGAEVTAAEAARSRVPTRSEGLSAPARSGPEGTFRVDGLAAGRWELAASDDGHRYATEVVEAGSNDVVLRMQAPGQVRGRVVGDDGAPLPEARVTASGRGLTVRERPVDETGAFTLGEVTPGKIHIQAAAPGRAAGSETVMVEADRAAEVTVTLKLGGTIQGRVVGLPPADVERCTVAAGSAEVRTRADGTFLLEGVRDGAAEVTASVDAGRRRKSVRTEVTAGGPPAHVDIDFSSGVTLWGTVYRASVPLPGMQVSVTVNSGRACASTVTGAGGEWRLAGLDPGEVELAAAEPRGRIVASRRLEVTRDMRADLHVATGSVSGRVVEAGTSDPVAGAEVSLAMDSDASVQRSVLSDEGGRFHFEDLPDGDARVRAQAAGFGASEAAATLRLGEAREIELVLASEGGLQLVLREADGRVPDAVLILPARDGRVEDGIWARTDRRGRVYVSTLPPGTYSVLLQAEGCAILQATIPAPPVSVTLGAAGTLEVFVSGGDPWRLRLATSGGVLVPIGAWLSPTRDGWIETRAGRATLHLPPGAYLLDAAGPGGRSRRQLVDLAVGGETMVRLE
jgi:protocatechuate 3,4-dioxygenase beta subunit